jgi:hypothetical protein
MTHALRGRTRYPGTIDPRLLGPGTSFIDLGCTLWLAADAITGVSDGFPLSTWFDASGHGRNATADDYQPAYHTNHINGLPVVLFDGGDAMVLSNFIVAPFTVFVVGKRTGGGQPQEFLVNGDCCMAAVIDSGANWGTIQSSWVASAVSCANTFRLMCLSEAAYNDYDFYTDDSAADAQTTGTQQYAFGSWYVGSDEYGQNLTGEIAEIIAFDTALGTADREYVRNYLNAKYAIY